MPGRALSFLLTLGYLHVGHYKAGQVSKLQVPPFLLFPLGHAHLMPSPARSLLLLLCRSFLGKKPQHCCINRNF